MKLKRVKVFGFKTFADKTEIDLEGKIIAVVGPNGCGKSNIVDAILWGLGESHARSLRSSSSKEVIFAGSLHRKQLGFAEVSLLFDNEDGTLPIDSPEVMVSRRTTRAGDTEYAINRRPCRLRDVNDLLADSGLGRAGYAIVGQSEIDQALAASAQQRRAWIDEAAGVQRYRARRTEALRRLEHAAEHLDRLRDILNEIDVQRLPLEAEAQVARAFKQLQNSLREIECGLLIKDLHANAAELSELGERIDSAMRLIDAETERCIEIEIKIEASQADLVAIESLTEELRGRLTSAQSLMEGATATLQVAIHKLENLDRLESSLTEETEAGLVRLSQAELDLSVATEEERAELEGFEQLRTDLSGVGEEASQLRASLKALDTQIVTARDLMAKRQRMEVELAHRDERLKHLRRELRGIAESLPDLKMALVEAESLFQAEFEAVVAAEQTIKSLEQALSDCRKTEELAGADRRSILADVASLEGRKRGIEATIEAHEGLSQGSKAVLAAIDRGLLTGDFAPVGGLVETDSELALAIDTALGGAAHDLVVPDADHAQRAIDYLKANRLGRATFQPLTLMRQGSSNQDVSQVLREKGVVGLASKLVRCEARYQPVIDSLLGRIVVTEDLETSLLLARTKGWSRMVTLDGEIVHSSGAVTGGINSRQGTGLVQRGADLADIEVKLEQLGADLKKAESHGGDQTARREGLRAQIEAAATHLAACRKTHEEARLWLVNLQHEWSVTEKSQAKLIVEQAQLLEIAAAVIPDVNLTELESQKDELLRRFAAKSSDADSAKERLRDADARFQRAKHRKVECTRRLQTLHETEALRALRSEGLEPEREKCRLASSEAGLIQEKQSKIIADLRETIQRATEEKREHAAKLELWRDEARGAEKSAAACSQTVHQAEILRARSDSRRSAIVERLLEEYGLNQEQALAQPVPGDLPEDSAQIVNKLRKDIRGMGDVNVGAIDAFDRLNERFTELNDQVEDLLRGKEEIEASVKELDRLTGDRFRETFAKLQVSFAKMFSRIFGGGEGSLDLSDTDDMLESGVDIQVTIPGKKRQRLEVLSGGERAMSALAFLFALLDVKPSPLVILDEVDAPLDGRNVERFISTMREFNDQTQFILITHNPVTIESADVWFGVTMQEPGVSTLVPFKVPEHKQAVALVPDTYLKG